MELEFYRCEVCGQIVAVVKRTGAPLVCCGRPMKKLEAGVSDGAVEKHVPVFTAEKNKVTVNVGAAAHPMTEAHHIEWVVLQTKEGNQRRALTPGGEPVVTFPLFEGDEVAAVYAYCNLHGLFRA